MIYIEQCRKDTPGCKTKIHFNNAGASLMPNSVIEAMKNYLALESVTGGYETADLKTSEIAGFYEHMARLLNSQPKNIAFTSSATNSYTRALSSISFERGDVILIAREDYISNQLAFLSMQQRLGVQLIRAGSLPEGGIDLDDLRRLMDKHRPKLVSLTHIPTNSGLVQPAQAVGKLCAEREVLYLLDACQSAGQLPLDVNAIHCDFLTGTFRKFLRGPRGAGFLYVSDHVLNKGLSPLFIDMRGADWVEKDSYTIRADARRFEDWEIPYDILLGSSAAARYATEIGLENIKIRNEELCVLVRQKLHEHNFTTLDTGRELSSIITVNMPGKDSGQVLQSLRAKNINTSITTRSSAVIDFDAKGVTWALRISPHYYNTEEEVDILIKALLEI